MLYVHAEAYSNEKRDNMISKEEAKQKLRKMGYQVVEDGSIVTILIPVSVSLKTTIQDLKEKLKEIDYEASFGVRQIKDAENVMDEQDKENSAPQIENTEEMIEETKEVTQEDIDSEGIQFSLEDFGLGF